MNPLTITKERDEKKKQLAAAKGITLVIVPGWWDGLLSRYLKEILNSLLNLTNYVELQLSFNDTSNTARS